MTDDLREKREKYNKLVATRAYQLAADPTEKLAVPELKEGIPFVDFTSVQNELAALRKTIDSLDTVDMLSLPTAKVSSLNNLMKHLEQSLTNEKGLPKRPWYRHMIYAPGFYTGYGVKTLPGIREAIEQEQWKEADEQMGQLAETLRQYNESLLEIMESARN